MPRLKDSSLKVTLCMKASRTASALVCLAIALASLGASGAGWLRGLDQRLLDLAFQLNRNHPAQTITHDVVVVGIDDAFVESIDEPLSLSHFYLADFLLAASAARARVIGLDLILPDKRLDQVNSARHPDQDFHRALLAGLIQACGQTPIVVAKQWDRQRSRFHEIQLDYAAVLAAQGENIVSQASAELHLDDDSVIRVFPDARYQPGRAAMTFSAAVAQAAGSAENWQGLINYQIGPTFHYLPLQRILDMAGRDDRAGLEKLMGGKIVLLGTVFDDADIHEMPVALAAWRPDINRLPGVLVHAQILRSMLNQGLVQPVGLLLSAPACLVLAMFWLGRLTRIKILALLAALALVLYASDVLLQNGLWLAPGALILAALLAFGLRLARQGWHHFKDKQRLTRSFSGYVSPTVLQDILRGTLEPSQAGKKMHVCVLFADVRNFTTMSEAMSAEQVVALLNRYFSRMTRVIHDHGGTVDKFIGDGLMAFFGAPNPLQEPEKNALEAALDMLRELGAMNVALAREGAQTLKIGIGLHAGQAVIGHIGSTDRYEYTAIGDVVNTASRLEGLCKELGCPLVCSQAVAGSLGYPAHLLPCGEQALKGRSAVQVYVCSGP